MSLYGGISFKGQAKPPAAAPSTADAPVSSSSAPPAAAATAAAAQPQAQDANSDKPKRESHTCPSRASTGEPDPPIRPCPAATWSAALRFAPTARKRPNAAAGNAAKPSASAIALKSAFGAAADDDDNGDANDSSSAAAGSKKGVSSGAFRIATVGKAALTAAPEKAPPVNKWSAVSRPVEEIKPFASTSSTANSSSSRLASPADNTKPRTRARRGVANTPAMTLEDAPLAASTAGGIVDVNGFAASAAGKKLAAQQNKKRGKKKRGGAGAGDGGGPHEDPALAFADVPYDPARPCDYVRGRVIPSIVLSTLRSYSTFRALSRASAITAHLLLVPNAPLSPSRSTTLSRRTRPTFDLCAHSVVSSAKRKNDSAAS